MSNSNIRWGALATLVLLSACGSGGASDAHAATRGDDDGDLVLGAASPKLAAVAIDTVRVTHERAVASFPAQVALDEDHTVRVSSPVTGRIRTLDARPGDDVAVGAALAHVSSSDFAQATSDLAKADAAAAQASAALTRAEDLFAHHVVAQKDLEQARSDAAQAAAEVARARQRTDQLGASGGTSGDFVLRSAIHGTVVDRSTNTGSEVRPDATTPLFTVSSLDTLWLIASVPQRDLAKLSRGARLAFTTDALPGRRFEATVVYVSDELDPVMRTATVRAALPNRDRALRALVVGEARLLVSDGSRQVVVPARALVTEGGETVVFVEKARGRFERRAVKVGDDDGATATIVEGLVPGELVVTKGSILLAAEAARQP
jgi:cobalt-zinc-cadmium efflux system membrane fusion protein